MSGVLKLLATAGVLGALLLSSRSGAAGVLPGSLAGMEARDAVLNQIDTRSIVKILSENWDTDCRDFRLFVYTDSAQATQGLTAWLSSAGLQATTIPVERGDNLVSQWEAQEGDTWVYGYWEADYNNPSHGLLQMCAGQPVQSARSSQGSRVRIRFPLWSIVGLGSALAGGVTKSIHKNPFSPDE